MSSIQQYIAELPDDKLLQLFFYGEGAVWKLAQHVWNKRHPDDPVGMK